MTRYKTFRTTMGHKVRMRMTDDEIAARAIYRIALVLVPFASAALMTFVWIRMG